MSDDFRNIIWCQFGAAIDALEKAVRACPDNLWGDNSKRYPFWQVVSHTLFWLDFYLSESPDGFTPPPPFGLEELDPAGRAPERTYSKSELLTYLAYGRRKCKETLESMTDDEARRPYKFGKVNFSRAELHLYNLRHVQHHTAQLNMILRLAIDSAPRWVHRAKECRD